MDDTRGVIAARQEREAFETLRERKQAYQLTFTNPVGQRVLQELAHFCRAYAPTWDDDARHHARLEGRREVYLRIMEYLDLTLEELFAIKTQRTFNPKVLEDTEEDDDADA